jgi:4-diphosphocytidyl-2-C-methyl-D-erythritol kinase
LKVVALAKINLFLWVGERRADGLHEVSTVMQSVSLADVLAITRSDAVSLTVSPPGSAPEDETNLIVAAVRAMRGACAGASGAGVSLSKRIPAGAGLGGGSADAAATLIGLNELWGCALSKKALEKLGASIGADVPFCVRGGTAGGIGAGERLGPLVLREPLWWVIAKPDGSLSTADVYARFDELGGPSSTDSDPVELADALARGDLDRIGSSLRNDLEPAAESLAPDLTTTRESLLGAGALAAMMSGSGPAWCGLARDEAHANQIASGLNEAFVSVVRSEPRGARIVER